MRRVMIMTIMINMLFFNCNDDCIRLAMIVMAVVNINSFLMMVRMLVMVMS